jgi:hypothetical protein
VGIFTRIRFVEKSQYLAKTPEEVLGIVKTLLLEDELTRKPVPQGDK